MGETKIKCMYYDRRFTEKPKGQQCAEVQKNLIQTEITLEQLACALTNGATFKPAVLVGGQSAQHWHQQQLFGLDFDDGVRIEEVYNKVKSLGITPCFGYTTFSHTEEHHKFRMVFCNDTVITDGIIRDRLQATLMGTIGNVDKVCFNRDRLFFGGKGHEVLYPDYEARINAESIIKTYWNDEYEQYISNKKKTVTKNIVRITAEKVKEIVKKIEQNNVDVISTLNVRELRQRLNIEGVLGDTDKEDSSSISITKNPDASEMPDDIYYFQTEAELYAYINSIDLSKYLGVPNGKFRCILPTHEDKEPSAHIYTTDDGTEIYKCFGCGQARTIISITEQLARCRRSEAINFIKQVYRIDYKPSEWVEQQRQLMIDSALYLDSKEFQETFPNINKVIRTRKTDIQKILFHMTKYIGEGLQLDGKPLFFASMPNLMKICDRKNKNIMSQSITLFALLDMLNKVEMSCIPENELQKAKSISAQYGSRKITNYYQIEEYGFSTLEESEKIAATLIENNMTLKGLTREYILRTFGIELADKVYPQYKTENRKGTSAKSDRLTGKISLALLETIKNRGYIFEREANLNGTVGNQWKKSIQEILDTYGLKRVRLNKELKTKYGIEGNGYPYIIIEDASSES